MTVKPIIYIAGPGVFHPDAKKDGVEKKRICEKYGFVGLYPLDNEIDPLPDKKEFSKKICDGNFEYIRKSHITIADLNPFRGSEPDSGTCFEAGDSRGLGHPVYGYVSHNLNTIEVVEKHYGPVSVIDGVYCDKNGARIEAFGNSLNLMLQNSVRLVKGTFEDCVKQVRMDLDNGIIKIVS